MRTRQTKIRLGLIVFTSAIALAACETPEPIEPTAVERSRAFSDVGLVELEPTAISTIRKGGNEIFGVGCQMQGPGYSARFTTPAVVLIPEYGKDSPLPTVTCALEDQTVTLQATLLNITEAETTSTFLHAGGLIGLAIGGAISSAREDKADDNYAFRSMILEFAAPEV